MTHSQLILLRVSFLESRCVFLLFVFLTSDLKLVPTFKKHIFLSPQIEAIKKISDFITQLRMVGKGHGTLFDLNLPCIQFEFHQDQNFYQFFQKSSLNLYVSFCRSLAFRPDAFELDWKFTLCSAEIKREETEEDSVKVARVKVIIGAKIRLQQ